MKRVVSWCVQLVLVFLSPTIAFAILESAHGGPDTVLSQLLGYTFLAVVSVSLALVVSRLNRGCAKEGAWIWVLPVVVVIWGRITDSYDFVNNYLLITRPGDARQAWGNFSLHGRLGVALGTQ